MVVKICLEKNKDISLILDINGVSHEIMYKNWNAFKISKTSKKNCDKVRNWLTDVTGDKSMNLWICE